MAVLKTGGMLNGCPCGFLERHGGGGGGVGREGSRERVVGMNEVENGKVGRGKDGRRVKSEERKEGRGRGKRGLMEGARGSIDLGRVKEVGNEGVLGVGSVLGNGRGNGSHLLEVNDGYLSVTAVDGSTRTSSTSNASSGGNGAGAAGTGGLRVGTRARTGSVASFESGGSGVSALDVYMGTRVS